MVDPSNVSLISVVVGGMLTVAGGVVAGGVTIIVTLLQRAAEKRKERAEKFEKLVAAIYEFDHWLEKKFRIQAYGDEQELPVSPFAKIEAVSAVYFPVFLTKISQMRMSSRIYEGWVAQAWEKRLAGKMGEINDGLEAVYRPYVEDRDDLLDELKKFGVENFQ